MLLAARDNPDNDVPRLMLADELIQNATRTACHCQQWTDDTHSRNTAVGLHLNKCDDGWKSDGRAEFASFIQYQLEWAKTPECPACHDTGKVGPCGLTDYFESCTCPDQPRAAHRLLRNRADTLLERHGKEWFPCRQVYFRLASFVPPKLYNDRWLVVRRGFPDEVLGVTVSDWVDLPGGPITSRNPCHEIVLPQPGLGRRIVAEHPTVTRVTVIDRPMTTGPHPYVKEPWYWEGRLRERYLPTDPTAATGFFDTEAEAYKAMSDVLINLARS